jgi:hypothetical protein
VRGTAEPREDVQGGGRRDESLDLDHPSGRHRNHFVCFCLL